MLTGEGCVVFLLKIKIMTNNILMKRVAVNCCVCLLCVLCLHRTASECTLSSTSVVQEICFLLSDYLIQFSSLNSLDFIIVLITAYSSVITAIGQLTEVTHPQSHPRPFERNPLVSKVILIKSHPNHRWVMVNSIESLIIDGEIVKGSAFAQSVSAFN